LTAKQSLALGVKVLLALRSLLKTAVSLKQPFERRIGRDYVLRLGRFIRRAGQSRRRNGRGDGGRQKCAPAQRLRMP
jgi:hypothetical protein